MILDLNSVIGQIYVVASCFFFCREVRECLKLDPDHKDCYPHYKKVKKLVKQMDSISNFIGESKWDDCVNKADAMLKTETVQFVYTHRANGHKCHCHSKVNNIFK